LSPGSEEECECQELASMQRKTGEEEAEGRRQNAAEGI
jgi:hypothetical protein